MDDEVVDTAGRRDIGEAVKAQLDQVRDRLLRDGAAHGVEKDAILQACDPAVEHFAEALIHSYIGVLVERAVRVTLSIPSTPT